MTTLGELMQQARERHEGASGRQLAELAQSHGFKIDRTQANALLKGTYNHTPQAPLVRAVAWLAGVADDVAFDAAQQRAPGRPFVEDLHTDADYLEPDERDAVNELIRLFTRGRATAGKVTPIRPAKTTEPVVRQRPAARKSAARRPQGPREQRGD